MIHGTQDREIATFRYNIVLSIIFDVVTTCIGQKPFVLKDNGATGSPLSNISNIICLGRCSPRLQLQPQIILQPILSEGCVIYIYNMYIWYLCCLCCYKLIYMSIKHGRHYEDTLEKSQTTPCSWFMACVRINMDIYQRIIKASDAYRPGDQFNMNKSSNHYRNLHFKSTTVSRLFMFTVAMPILGRFFYISPEYS